MCTGVVAHGISKRRCDLLNKKYGKYDLVISYKIKGRGHHFVACKSIKFHY